MEHPMEDRPRRSAPPAVLTTLYCYAVLTAAAGLLPPLVAGALRLPEARTPVWIASAVVSGGLALLLTSRRRRPSRRLVLSLGWLLVVLATAQAFVVADLPALVALYAVVPVLASLAGRLTGRPRKALVVTHVIAAACWTGVALMMSAVGVTALTSDDIERVAGAYGLMETFDVGLLAWLNFATTMSGLAVSLTSRWGVIRYRWVAAKLALSLLILLLAFGWLHDTLETAALQAERLAASGGPAERLGTTPALVAAGFGLAFLQLVLATLLSLYKPGGRTRRGRRLLAAQRGARSGRTPVTVADGQRRGESTMNDDRPSRRGVLGGVTAAAAGLTGLTAAGAAGPWATAARAATADTAAAPGPGAPGRGGEPLRRVFAHPVLGTWRGTVSRSDGEVEQTLLAFHPGGMFTAFTDGIHVAVGRWEDRGETCVRFGLWQVLPVDIHGQPHAYQGEVRALHEATLSGDTLVSRGVGKGIDLDGNVLLTVDVEVRATRFGLTLPESG